MSKIINQSRTLRARKARAEKNKPAFLSGYGFKNGQPRPEDVLSELFRFWGLLDHYLYVPARNARLRHLIKIGVLAINQPLVAREQMPDDIDSRRYRVLKRHRLLGNVDPAPPPAPTPTPAEIAKTTSIKDRVKAEAAEMKRAGEIPENIPRQTFAKDLAQRIGEPKSYRYIGKDLAEWGLWPIAVIQLLLPPPKDGN